jgi:hypothetical protein
MLGLILKEGFVFYRNLIIEISEGSLDRKVRYCGELYTLGGVEEVSIATERQGLLPFTQLPS